MTSDVLPVFEERGKKMELNQTSENFVLVKREANNTLRIQSEYNQLVDSSDRLHFLAYCSEGCLLFPLSLTLQI